MGGCQVLILKNLRSKHYEYLQQNRQKGGEEYMFGIGYPELIVLSLVLLVLVGGKKLPELARGIGDSVKEFKKAAK